MAINLKKELESIKRGNKNEEQKNLALSEAKLLLASNEKAEIEALKSIGLGHSIEKMEKDRGAILEREQFEKSNGDTFSESEIKELCILYKLRFLESKKFNGNLSPEVGAKLVRYCSENDINIESSYYSKSFFIAAPAKSFKLQKKPKDPLLFHYIGNANGEPQYKLVHKWGNDFSYARYIKGFMHRNFKTAYISSFFISWILISFLGGLWAKSNSIFGIGTLIITGILAFGVTWLFNLDSSGEWEFSEDNWNSKLK